MSPRLNAISTIGLLASLLATFFLAPTCFGTTPRADRSVGDPVVTITNADQVYFPTRVKKGATFKKPAVLTTATIFNAIPEWQEIKKKNLTEKDAEYHLLLKKANDKFDCGIRIAQKNGGYDIIAEQGAISCKNCAATDITSDVIAALP